MRTCEVLEEIFKEGEFSDVFYEKRETTILTYENMRFEEVISGVFQGLGARIIRDRETIYSSTNDLSKEGINRLMKDISSNRKKKINFLERKPSIRFCMKIDPKEVELEKKVEYIERAKNIIQPDSRVSQFKIGYIENIQQIEIANSDGVFARDKRSYIVFYALVVAKEGEIVQTGYELYGVNGGIELICDEIEKVARTAKERAIKMLYAKTIKGGLMPVVISSEAGGTMIHEAVGHGLEADLAMKGLSVYSGKIGEMVASPLISVVDDATLFGKRGSFVFDDEGTPAKRNVLIDKGKLCSYMSDLFHAKIFGTSPTGNGRRESFRVKPIPRMTNTFILPGETPPEKIIESTDKGLFVKKMGGGQVNTVNGDFVFEVSEGYTIERGEIGDPVRDLTISGNGPEVLKIIDMVGSDLGFGVGTCGKDGQSVPVSDAQPTIRIPEIVVGGKV